ncbi:hypothetical protein O4J56_02490 [Nocardiopsis sp. RSe5-2]|uniref:DUF3558 domain-containing protein n=1 Tax=Nocardiopsis endophytica TaxID=3018445 RepID=A0ABT4TYL3_9ACTN|nr:hypothetical protein [Nocardiopsis endophytica]MDA2809496.1 hypothetical protein [Nocardiopsis endophytica]
MNGPHPPHGPQGPQPPLPPQGPPPQGPPQGPPPGSFGPPGHPGPQGGPPQPPNRPPKKKSRVGGCLAIGCGVLLVLVLAAGGGGAYYLGWFDRDDGYARLVGVCPMVDEDKGVELSGDPSQVYESDPWEIPGSVVTEYACHFPIEYGDREHNDTRVSVLLHATTNNGISRATGEKTAEVYFTESMVENNGLTPTTCSGGREIHSGFDGGGETRRAMAGARVANLVFESAVDPAEDSEAGLSPDERKAAAEELLCGALENLPPKE